MSEWIEWNGGKRPTLDGNAAVEVLFRDGNIGRGWVDSYYWPHDDDETDIVKYRQLASQNQPQTRFNAIRTWAAARNLLKGSTTDKQFLKLVEETGEIAQGLAKNRPEEVKDGIGDVVVVLTILAAQMGFTIEECIEQAWGEIKHRTGRLENGVFIKSGD